MTTTTAPTFVIEALDAHQAEWLRHRTFDENGRPIERVTASGGEPLRCCLTDAVPGEAMLLASHEPSLPADSPYLERGAIYLHAQRCAGRPASGRYPAAWLARPQALRAYDARGWLHPATTWHDGTDPEGALASVLGTDGVVEVHSHNLAYGCYMFRATRP